MSIFTFCKARFICFLSILYILFIFILTFNFRAANLITEQFVKKGYIESTSSQPRVNFAALQANGEHPKRFFYNAIGNFLLFFPLGLLAYYNLRQCKNPLFVSLFFCVALSLFIELAQYYFPERDADINDLICNSAGGFFGIIIMRAIQNARESNI